MDVDMLKMTVEGAGSESLSYELKKAVISVGASSTNDVVIRSPGVGPTHIIFQRSGEVVTFLAQSRQVVSLNGERRARGVVRAGDRVRIGTVTLAIEEVDSPTLIDQTAKEGSRSSTESKRTGAAKKGGSRSEVVLFSEPNRLASARDIMTRALCANDGSRIREDLRAFFEEFFPNRCAMLATLDGDGSFDPVFSSWDGEPPLLPKRTFEELAREGRYAHLRMASEVFLIFPVQRKLEKTPFYLVVQSDESDYHEDEIVLGELARMLLVKWPNLETSQLVADTWLKTTAERLNSALPGTSALVRSLREDVMRAASSRQPSLITGRRGSGRTWLAQLMASLCPAGPRSVHLIDVSAEGGDQQFRFQLYGGEQRVPLAEVVKQFGGASVLVIRNIHWLSSSAQDELAELMSEDRRQGLGPSLRWMATSDRLAVEIGDAEFSPLLAQFRPNIIAIPEFSERREDLPLIVLSEIERLAQELDKTIAGMTLPTLNSILCHDFEGQMAELLRELTRLVVATPDGEMIRGTVPLVGSDIEFSPAVNGESSMAELLMRDDLKTVIPAVEKVIMDRVLRKTMGNQSKAARDLNLSRGALISKIKDYEIPDYRYLRRGGKDELEEA